MNRILLMTVAVMALSGCARMIDGSTQLMTIETPGANGANCYIENEEFRYRLYAPQTVRITRSFYPLNVRCLAPGNRQKTVTLVPKIQESTFMNAANGFIPGMMVDYNSRAFYKFPETVVVDFTDMKPERMPPPHHDLLLRENPHLRGMEEFRPGLPALQSDGHGNVHELRKREIPAGNTFSSDFAITPAPAPMTPAPRGGSAEDLTRQMNPQVFTGSEGWMK